MNLTDNELHELILADATRLEKALLERVQHHLGKDVEDATVTTILKDIQDFFQKSVVALSGGELPPMSVRLRPQGKDVVISIILHTNEVDQEVGISELIATVYAMALS